MIPRVFALVARRRDVLKRCLAAVSATVAIALSACGSSAGDHDQASRSPTTRPSHVESYRAGGSSINPSRGISAKNLGNRRSAVKVGGGGRPSGRDFRQRFSGRRTQACLNETRQGPALARCLGLKKGAGAANTPPHRNFSAGRVQPCLKRTKAGSLLARCLGARSKSSAKRSVPRQPSPLGRVQYCLRVTEQGSALSRCLSAGHR